MCSVVVLVSASGGQVLRVPGGSGPGPAAAPVPPSPGLDCTAGPSPAPPAGHCPGSGSPCSHPWSGPASPKRLKKLASRLVQWKSVLKKLRAN